MRNAVSCPLIILALSAHVLGYIPDMNSRPYDFACVNGGWGDVADAVAILRLADKGLINLKAWGIKTAKEDDGTRYRESNEFLELGRKDGLKNVPSKTLGGVSESHVLHSSGTTGSNPLSLPAANSEMGKKLADLAREASPGDELIIMSGDCMIPIADMVLILNNSDALKNVWVLQSAHERIAHVNNGTSSGRKEPKAYQVVVSSKLNVVFGDDICGTPGGDKKNDKCDFPGPSDGGMHIYKHSGESTSMNWWKSEFDKSLGNLRDHMIDLVARGQSRVECGSYDPSYMLGLVHGYLPEKNRVQASAKNNGREVGPDPNGNVWYGKLDNTAKQDGKTVIEHWKNIVNGEYTLAKHGGKVGVSPAGTRPASNPFADDTEVYDLTGRRIHPDFEARDATGDIAPGLLLRRAKDEPAALRPMMLR